MSWRAVFWGLGLQFVLGLVVIRTEPGFIAFQWLGDQIQVCTWGVAARASWVAGDGGEASALEGGGLDCDQVVGVWGPPDPWAVGGWAAQLLLPSGLSHLPKQAVLSEGGLMWKRISKQEGS